MMHDERINKIYSTLLPDVWLVINMSIFSYNSIEHKWVHYLFGDHEARFKRFSPYIIHHYDCKTYKIRQFTSPFLIYSNKSRVERKLKILLG